MGFKQSGANLWHGICTVCSSNSLLLQEALRGTKTTVDATMSDVSMLELCRQMDFVNTKP
jgi:hypothetical protein